MFRAVRLRAVRAAIYELFVHSERIRAVTQGVYMLNLCNILCYSISVEIYCYVFKLFEKQPVIMCIYSYNHFGTNPVHLIKMKCCGAVPNEMSLSEIAESSSERKRVNSL